jgi:hypothetical protein
LNPESRTTDSDQHPGLDRFCFSTTVGADETAVEQTQSTPERNAMPTISMFYGILIRMFFNDIERHHLPHIHAEYQGQVGTYAIPDGSLLAGELPPNKHKLVVAWIEIHQDDLVADWELAVNGKKPFPIKGLDQ